MADKIPLKMVYELGIPVRIGRFEPTDTLDPSLVRIDNAGFAILTATQVQALANQTDAELNSINNGQHRKTIQTRSTSTIDLNQSPRIVIPFDIETVKTAPFTHDNALLNTRHMVGITGLYELSYKINGAQLGNNRKNIVSALAVSGATVLDDSIAYSYSRNTTNNNFTNQCSAFIAALNAGDYIELLTLRSGDGGVANNVANQTWLRINLWQQ